MNLLKQYVDKRKYFALVIVVPFEFMIHAAAFDSQNDTDLARRV